MRIAAGIIFIILVVSGLVALIIDVRVVIGSGPFPSPVSLLWQFVYLRIVQGGFLVAAGVLCLKGKYWGLCLATALYALLIGISSVVEMLLHEHLSIMAWRVWILFVGALISTIFISLTKKEWQEIQG